MAFISFIGGVDGINGNKLPFSEFMKKVNAEEVTQVEIKGNDLVGKLKDGTQFYTFLPQYPNLVEKLQDKGVSIDAIPLVS